MQWLSLLKMGMSEEDRDGFHGSATWTSRGYGGHDPDPSGVGLAFAAFVVLTLAL